MTLSKDFLAKVFWDVAMTDHRIILSPPGKTVDGWIVESSFINCHQFLDIYTSSQTTVFFCRHPRLKTPHLDPFSSVISHDDSGGSPSQDDQVEEGGGLWHKRRGKIVRSDFIQTIQDGGHWIHKEVERNSLAYWDGQIGMWCPKRYPKILQDEHKEFVEITYIATYIYIWYLSWQLWLLYLLIPGGFLNQEETCWVPWRWRLKGPPILYSFWCSRVVRHMSSGLWRVKSLRVLVVFTYPSHPIPTLW